jgi:hypothetical protein
MGKSAPDVVKVSTGGLTAVPKLWGDLSGANAAAKAAEKAGNAQAAAAGAQQQLIMNEGQRLENDVMNLAKATPQELAALDRSLSSATTALDREERLLAAIDPALMEASQQALSLLRGESAGINKPMTDMRNMQRQQLLNSLRSQYGPGAESTSIGQRVLQQFDMESNSMLAQNQQNSLNQVFGIATADAGGRARQSLAGLQGVGQGYGAIQQRLLNARSNAGASTLGALSGTTQQMIQAAGAPYVGDVLRAQGQQGLFNTVLQGGMMYASGGMSGAAGAAKPTMARADNLDAGAIA